MATCFSNLLYQVALYPALVIFAAVTIAHADPVSLKEPIVQVAPSGELISGTSEVQSVPLSGRGVWTYPLFMSNLGASDIWAGHTTEGNSEVYFGCYPGSFGTNTYWTAITFNTVTRQYYGIFASEYFLAGIKKIDVGNVTGDSAKEIVVALGDGKVHIYDQETKVWLKSFSTLPGLLNMRVADIDNTGWQEIVVCTATASGCYADGVHQWTILTAGGKDLVIAQMDADPSLEMATGDGKVLDISSQTIQWNWGRVFGVWLEAADWDGDGMAELVAAEEWQLVTAFNVDTQSQIWAVPTAHNISALAITDFNDDGQVEVAIGDAQWGHLYAIDPVTKNLKYSMPNLNGGVTGIVATDIDSDGQKEIIWGTGSGSSGADGLVVSNPYTNQSEWSSSQLDGPLRGPLEGDLDGNSESEIVVGTFRSNSGYSSGVLLVFDSLTMQLRAQSPPIIRNRSNTGLHELELYDIDKNGDMEIVIASDDAYNGVISIMDLNTSYSFTERWTNNPQPKTAFYDVEIADVDFDGNPEVIAAGDSANSPNGNFFVYDLETTNTLQWSARVNGRLNKLKVADLSSTPGLEIVGLTQQRNAYLLSLTNTSPELIFGGRWTSVDTKEKFLYLGDQLGNLARYDFNGNSFTTGPVAKLSNTALESLEIVTTAPLAVNFTSQGIYYVYSAGVIRSQTASYGTPYGSIATADGVSAGLFAVVSSTLPAPALHPEPETTLGRTNTLSWSRVSGAGSYYVEKSRDPEFSASTSSGWISAPSYTVSNLEPGETYYYRVKARTPDGMRESRWSRLQSSMQQNIAANIEAWPLY